MVRHLTYQFVLFKLRKVINILSVQFRGDKLASERIYWDQATVLQQVGLL